MPGLSTRLGPLLASVVLWALAPLAWADASSPWQLTVLGPEQQPLARVDLPAGGHWCMVWNHSVQGFAVEDCYRVEHGRLLLSSSHQPDFAAGLGHTPGRGRLESDDHQGYRIVDIDEPVPANRFVLRVGAQRVNHRIRVGERIVSLSRLAAGERLEIRLEPAPDATPNGRPDS